MSILETASPGAHPRPNRRSGAALFATVQVGIALVVTGAQCLNAGSLSGKVMDEQFEPLSGATVRLSPEGKSAPAQRSVSTDEKGVFIFSGLAPGQYAIRVDFRSFISVVIEKIRIGDAEERHLRRILLEGGEVQGRCIVRINARSNVQHTSGNDIEISGRVLIRRGESAAVTLFVFTENEALEQSAVSDNQGRFQFVIPVAGDIRLWIEIENRSGKTVIPEQEANVPWADLGDRIKIPRIQLTKSGLGHFCY